MDAPVDQVFYVAAKAGGIYQRTPTGMSVMSVPSIAGASRLKASCPWTPGAKDEVTFAGLCNLRYSAICAGQLIKQRPLCRVWSAGDFLTILQKGLALS